MTTAISPETRFESLGLEEGDAEMGFVENGQIFVTVHHADEIAELEASFDEARNEPGIPLNDSYFDGLRE